MMMIWTRVSEMLAVNYPLIIEVSSGELAASAAQAGGIGLINVAALANPQDLQKEIAAANPLAPGAFGVSVDLDNEQAAGFIDTAIKAGVRTLFTTGQNLGEWSKALKSSGAVWVHKCATLEQTEQAQKLGADAVVLAQPNNGGTSLIQLIPEAAEKMSVPVIMGGPITGGGGLIAALALGAEGVLLDTALSLPLKGVLEHLISEAIEVQRSITQTCLRAFTQSTTFHDQITYVFPESN